MTDSIRRGLKMHIAGMIESDIRYQRSNYYYFLGKTDVWGSPDVPPLSTVNSETSEIDIRSDSIFFKKISSNDISLVTKRYDWSSGSIFDKWDHTKDMSGLVFYCLTNNNAVYKCLDNNGGGTSTIKPQDKSFNVFRTSDGYLWKYMYTIPQFKYNRFASSDYIPVQKALTNSFYNKGSIEQATITSHGQNYLNTSMTTIGVSSSTTKGSGADITIVTDEIGSIVGINIIRGGSNYTHGITLNVISETGYGSKITPIITNGVISGFIIVAGGTGYIDNSLISVSVGGAILVPSISQVTGSIDKVIIINGGSGYSSAPTLTLYNSGNIGSGKYDNQHAIIEAIVFDGKIVGVNVIDPGVGYSTSKDTIITVSGNGSGAKFSPVVYGGEIIDIVVDNSGTGYTSAKFTVTGSGSGAVIQPIISASDFISDQSTVEQLSISGAIFSIEVSTQGTHYSQNTTITVVGDGTGCLAYPVIVDGAIKKIVVTQFGKNYTYADIVITDAARVTILNSIDAITYVILPPNKGHGYNAVSELYGSVISINSSFREESALNNILQNYRRFGLVNNPTNVVDGRLLTDASYLITYSVVLDTTANLLINEVMVCGTGKFRVISISGLNVILQQIGKNNKSPLGILTVGLGDEVPRTYTAYSVTSQPIANKYSGDLLYVSDSTPFSLDENQSITIKTFLKF